ncbi:MAG TPA: hypothetical protein VFL98_04040 [Candidatus Paceibacterota bacterium]|nr:hypothetical protein [Candidatus Paceibacterota bacterium]
MVVETWANALQGSFQGMWAAVIMAVPDLIVAILIFIIGWIVGSIISRIIAQVIHALHVDNALRSAGIEELLGRAGIGLDSGVFVGELVKWFIVVVFLVASLDVLHLQQVNVFLQTVVLYYLPQVIVAVLILLLAAVIAEVAKSAVIASARAAGATSANLLGTVTKWAIWIFALMAALLQLGVAQTFLQTLFMGFVFALSLACGLAFGLGGRDAAADTIDSIRKEMMSHKK